MTVYLQDLAEEHDGVWWFPRGLSLEDEDVVGPCVVSLVGGEESRVTFENCVTYGNWAGVWIERDGIAPLGSVHVRDVSFVRCHLRGVSFVATRETVDKAARSTRFPDAEG